MKLLLGIHSPRVETLIQGGVLNPLRGPSVDGNANWRFDRKEIYALLERIRSKLRVRRGHRALSFKTWSRRLDKVGISLATFLQAVLNDEICPLRQEKKAGFLPGLSFSAVDVDAFVRDELHLRAGDVLSIPEFAAAVGVSKSVIGFMVKKNIIKAEFRAGLKRVGRLIARGEIDAFNSTYFLPSKLAPTLQTTAGCLVEVLSAQGITPVSGSNVDDGYLYVFKRSNLVGIDLKALLTTKRAGQKDRLAESRLLDEAQAASLLGVPSGEVANLVQRGILRPHNRLPKGKGLFFSIYTVEKLKGRVADYDGLVSLQVAAKLLGISESRLLEKYIYVGRLIAPRREGKRGQYFFKQVDVEALADVNRSLKQGTMNSAEVAELCGVNITCVHKWTVAGILQPVSGPKVDGAATNLYAKVDVEKLHGERAAHKARSLRAGKTTRYGRPLRAITLSL